MGGIYGRSFSVQLPQWHTFHRFRPKEIIMRKLSRRHLMSAAIGTGALTLMPLAKAQENRSERRTEQFDVVVVGAGFAGMCAALEAHEQGANVVLLEKMGSPQGNSIYAGGWVCAIGSRFQKNHPEDTKEAFYADMMKVSKNQSDPALLKTYVDNCGPDIDWLADHGFDFHVWENLPYPELSRMLSVPGDTRGGAVLIRHLLAALREAKVDIRYNTKAIELVVDDDLHVEGVSCLTDTGRCDFLAKGGVVLAAGGFGSNKAMVTQFMGAWASRLVPRGSPWTTGEDIRMADSVMAKLIGMDQFYAGPITPTGSANPNNIMQTGYGIQVNDEGKRFLQESWLQVPRAKAVAQLTKNNLSFMLVDASTDKKDQVLSKAIKRFARLNVPTYKGETIEEVAEAAGIPPETLLVTVREYNEAVRAGKASRLTPPYNIADPKTLETPPFYLIPVSGGICSTMGGIAINTHAEVLNTEEKVILGLYAAGASTGGIWYDDDLGGNQLGGCMVFGRIAGRSAAQRAKQRA